jgi:hypothetical protein
MPLLTAKALYFGNRNPLNAVVGECFTNVVKLEWLDDSGDEFHPGSPLLDQSHSVDSGMAARI